MRVSSKRIAAVAVIAGIFFALLAGGALAAPPWLDAPRRLLGGERWGDRHRSRYRGGRLRRQHLQADAGRQPGSIAKMAVNGLDLAPVDALLPTFLDVAKGSTFFTCRRGSVRGGSGNGVLGHRGVGYRPVD